MVSDVLVAFDHLRHEVTILANVFVGRRTWTRAYAEAAAAIADVRERLAAPVPQRARRRAASRRSSTSNIGRGRATRRRSSARKEYIRAGDAYQVVPSQRWSADCPVDAFSIYRGLRAVNPSPYMYFLDFEDFEIAGASPESLVKVDGPARRAAPDRRHPAAGGHREADRERARGAAGRREGARRARDARGPGPQRPGPRVRVRQRHGRRADGRRDLLARAPHRLLGVGHAARGRDADGRAARVAARRHAVGRAEDPRHADHRRAGARQARPLRRRGRLPVLHGRPGHLHLHPLGAGARTARVHVQAGGGIVADSDPDYEMRETEAKARRGVRGASSWPATAGGDWA